MAWSHEPARPRSTAAAGSNPFGKIPTLFDDDLGLTMYESIAINTHLGDKYRGQSGVPMLVPPPATPSVISPTASADITVRTTNEGDREGDQVLMLFHFPRTYAETLRDLALGTPLPQRKLMAFKRISLPAQASADVTFSVTAESLGLVDNSGDTHLFAGMHELRVWQGNGAYISRDVQVQKTTLLRQLAW